VLRKIIKKIKPLGSQGSKNKSSEEDTLEKNSQQLSQDLQVNLNSLKVVFEDANDIVIREFKIGVEQQVKAFLIFVDGLVDKVAINESLLKSLMLEARLAQPNQGINKNNAFRYIKECALSIASVKESRTLKDAIDAVVSGDVVLFLDGSDTALIISIRGWEARGVTEPVTETVVRGPREGFVETIRSNTALIRRKIKNPNLKFESLKIGKETQTDVCIAYIKGIANEKIVREVKERLERIEIDSILESGYIESFIEDAPLSMFPTVGNSEKPDIVSAKMLEGRVAILVDGTPFVLTVPYLLVEVFQSSEDYYSRAFYSSIIRNLRFLSFAISVLLPAIYVAVTTFHHEMLPPALFMTMAASGEGLPFPALIEALGMGITFEILREAGVRLPRPVGQAVSIVGALVIGETAVSAGLISPAMVIVVALTAISSFVAPALTDASSLVRVILTLLSGVSGLYGIILGIAGILTHLCSLRSFGVPYTSPLAPTTFSDLKDVFIRVPWWAMSTRPRVLGIKQPIRQKPGQMPKPPEDDTKN